jgi:hypothetical protein
MGVHCVSRTGRGLTAGGAFGLFGVPKSNYTIVAGPGYAVAIVVGFDADLFAVKTRLIAPPDSSFLVQLPRAGRAVAQGATQPQKSFGASKAPILSHLRLSGCRYCGVSLLSTAPVH